MKLKDIVAITGQSSLFKYIAQSPRGIIVESLSDGKRMTASLSMKISSLADISIHTEYDNVLLADVFEKLFAYTEGKPAISPKSSPEEMRVLFDEFFPEYDRNRVYTSDIKKIISWFNILVESGMTEFKIEEEETVSK